MWNNSDLWALNLKSFICASVFAFMRSYIFRWYDMYNCVVNFHLELLSLGTYVHIRFIIMHICIYVCLVIVIIIVIIIFFLLFLSLFIFNLFILSFSFPFLSFFECFCFVIFPLSCGIVALWNILYTFKKCYIYAASLHIYSNSEQMYIRKVG